MDSELIGGAVKWGMFLVGVVVWSLPLALLVRFALRNVAGFVLPFGRAYKATLITVVAAGVARFLAESAARRFILRDLFHDSIAGGMILLAVSAAAAYFASAVVLANFIMQPPDFTVTLGRRRGMILAALFLGGGAAVGLLADLVTRGQLFLPRCC